MSAADPLAWWAELPQGGWMLSPEALATLLEREPAPLPERRMTHLHAVVSQFLEAEKPTRKQANHLIDLLLQDTLGYAHGWLKPSAIGAEWTRPAVDGGEVKPQRLWRGSAGEVLPVFQTEPDVALGVGRGRQLATRAVEWLRRKGVSVALLTNGTQWRLLHASADHASFVEWHAAGFFEAAQPAAPLLGMRKLLGIQALRAEAGSEGPLLTALKATRKGRADLAGALGERVRQAVEILIAAQAPAIDAIRDEVPPRVLYLAACRIIMRLVVLLFAEARGLLPRDNPVYREAYGLSSLQSRLERHASRASSGFSAWPAIVAAFRMVHQGSHHRDLLIPAYGGALFEAGDPQATDELSRALAALESPAGVSDQAVCAILDRLCRTHVRVRLGKQNTRMTVPVDFSDLSGTTIGMLYEGLLDFELRRAPDEPVLFLNLGKQPAMPLDQLEALDDAALKSLLDDLRKYGPHERNEDAPEDDTPPPRADADETAAAEPDTPEASEPLDGVQPPSSTKLATGKRVEVWALRAVAVGKLLPAKDLADPSKRQAAAHRLVARIVHPGEWYLVRWGGTRKGSGTFYTRAELAVPLVRRTLAPLLGGETLVAPEQILALKICDPSMGSGSFLVAALRILTDALLRSLYAHGRIQVHGPQTVVTLASGQPSCGELCEETLPQPPDHASFEPALRARLKRHLVERCLYGIDLDPLAVELGKLALWVETMDRDLPFGFLDHKLKVGNALIGTWLDSFLTYPVQAWERESGEKGHTGVHFAPDAWAKALKEGRARVRTEQQQVQTGSLNWLRADRSTAAAATHAEARATMEKLHGLPVHRADLRAEVYRAEIAQNPALAQLKLAFDTHCALWFWPADRLESAPTPLDYLDPTPATRKAIAELSALHRFFHWELEFPDVFATEAPGFDAMLGNPPWETLKPNSQEFFSDHDPRYRSYGKQEALRQQRRYFQADASLERRWLEANATLKAMTNWIRHAATVGGSAAAAPRAHPYRLQGSGDPNTYKLFLELAHALLKPRGRMGMIVPASLYADKGTQALREEFLDRCVWEWLFAFENRQRLFDIHSSFKFCLLVLAKGGRTVRLQTAFMRTDPADWEQAERIAFPYDAAGIKSFSPRSLAFFELGGPRDVALLRRITTRAIPLGTTGPGGWRIQSSCEFHMTADSGSFAARPDWEAKGYRPDDYGHWLGPEGAVALPLVQGVMIHQFDPAAKAWIRGTGLAALWEGLPWDAKRLSPQFLMALSDAARKGMKILLPKVTYRTIARNTDERTLIAALNPGLPCGHKLGVLRSEEMFLNCALVALLNSFVLDWVARIRIGGTQVDAHVIAELPLVDPSHPLLMPIALNALRLNATTALFAPLWLAMQPHMDEQAGWSRSFCLTPHERLRVRCITEALVASMYGLSHEDLALILSPDTSNPSGFWRVDRNEPTERRLTTLTLAAYRDLLARGPEAFLQQNDGEGWLLPEKLDVDGNAQPVRACLGPRLLPWQEATSPAEDWSRCREHAAFLAERLGIPAQAESSGTRQDAKQPCLF